MTHLPGEPAEDAQRWWRACQLAGSDRVDELRRLAAAGDEHARRQLAGWLSDRAYTGSFPDRDRLDEAIEVIRPLADAGDDVAGLWLARWLADCGRLEELRQRADGGGYHASRELARSLAGHDMLDELRARADAGSYPALEELAEWLASREHLGELRALLVDHREQLAEWLARGAYPMRWCAWRRNLAMTPPGGACRFGWPGCASAPILAMSTPGNSWPRIRTGSNSRPGGTDPGARHRVCAQRARRLCPSRGRLLRDAPSTIVTDR